jgi:hypothetical protein
MNDTDVGDIEELETGLGNNAFGEEIYADRRRSHGDHPRDLTHESSIS